MHTGKISEIAYKRSVLKKIRDKSENLQVGIDGAHMAIEDVTMVMSSNCILKWFPGCERYYLQKTLNDIYASGGNPKYVYLQINIPNDFEEKQLGRIVKSFDDASAEIKINIQRCDVYAGNISEVMIHVNVIGISERTFSIQDIKENTDIVMAGTIAVGTTAVLTKLHESRLREKFHDTFVDDCLKISEFTDIKKITDIAKEQDILYMHHVSDGGVFAAVWEMVSAVNLGIEIDIKKIPVWQETIEIAEVFDYNPYMIDGTGAVLIAVKDGTALVEKLESAGIYADVIGHITSGRDRVVMNGDERRFLEPPRGDEIYNYLNRKGEMA